MNEYTNNVNIESLQSSLETITSIDNCLKSVDLTNYFGEMEIILRKVNFEHGNCMVNYKKDINSIYEKLEEMKKNIDSTKNALEATVEGFSKTEQIELRKDDQSSPQLITAATDITQIPPVTTPEQVQPTTQTTDNTLNTVPIGLGIAAAGITGSIGAVVYDSMKSPHTHKTHRKEDDLETYQEPEEYIPSTEKQAPQTMEPVFDDSPYHAARNKTAMNKFYGTDITEYYEKEDEDEPDS